MSVHVGSPARREPDGDGVPVVVRVRESLTHGQGGQGVQPRKEGGCVMRKCQTPQRLETGEPGAMKVASTVRKGTERKGLATLPRSQSTLPHTRKLAEETIALIRQMAKDNRLWGAGRIRGELLKLGLRVCKRTIQKYMRTVRTKPPRGQKWATFLRNHAAQVWACDAPPGH